MKQAHNNQLTKSHLTCAYNIINSLYLQFKSYKLINI